tara:strand:+ start:63629 stop:64813 length:1185 start_codon:yes stop_codon:yes gene_type:complete
MLPKITLVAIFYVLGSLSISAQDTPTDINIGTIHSLHSNVLNEDRPYWLSLPANFDPEKPYPVIYMTDGDLSFHFASGMLKQLAATGKIPDIILVSIPNTDRNRDLTPTHTEVDSQGKQQSFLKTTGGGDNFIEFIKTELSSRIEENYTTSKFRIYIGHSFGGLLVTHAFLEHSDFFNAFLAIDPSLWWDDRVMNRNLLEKISQKRSHNSTYYMSSANNDNPLGNTMLEPQMQFMDSLTRWDTDTLNVKREYFSNDNHGSVDLISVYNGLQFIFDKYKLDFEKAVEDPNYLDEHFSNFSKRIGYNFSPGENVINRLAYTYLFVKKDKDKALDLFIQNTQNYPDSSNTYDSLSDAYKEIGNNEMVIKNLEKAIELDPNAEGSKRKLKEFLESDRE